MKNNFVLVMIAIISLLAIAIVSAEVTQTNNIYYGTIADDGSLITTNTPITNFNVIGFICGNNDCSNVTGTLWNGAALNSGSNSQINLIYPTNLEQDGYGVFFYKDGYFPYEVKSNWSGTGSVTAGIRYLTKKVDCQVPINHLIISTNGTNVSVSVTLDSGVSSPVQNAGPLNYTPNSIAYLYAVNSIVNFSFIGPKNISISENVSLPASESREVFASTNLAAGQYTIQAESNTNDSKCINSIPTMLSSNLLISGNLTNGTLPLISILSPQPINYTNSTILVQLHSVNATSVLYNWNGTNVSYTAPVYANFSEGKNTLYAYAINNLTTAIASVTFFVNTSSLGNQTNQTDTTPPASITNLHLISKGMSYINWGWTNPTDSDFSEAIIYLDGINVANTSNNFYGAISLQPDSNHTITINTKDFSGNINFSNVSDTEITDNQSNNTDTTPPASITNLHLFLAGTSFLDWVWNNPNDSDFSLAIVYINGINVENTSNNYYNAQGLQSSTSYNITINTEDFSGNVNYTNVSDTETTLSNPSNNPGGGGGGNGGSGLHPRTFTSPVGATNISIPTPQEDNPIGPAKLQTSSTNWLLWLILFLLVNLAILIAIMFIVLGKPRKKQNNQKSFNNTDNVFRVKPLA